MDNHSPAGVWVRGQKWDRCGGLAGESQPVPAAPLPGKTGLSLVSRCHTHLRDCLHEEHEQIARIPHQAVRYFADAERCFEFVLSLRWADGVVTCPRCDCQRTSFLTSRKIWKCLGCKRQFSIKVGTIFEDSSLGFDKWLPAIWLIANSKNGISSYELARSLGVTQKTAWFMNHRIRLAMASGTFQKLSGTVETDETYIGGLGKNMHLTDRKRKIHGTGGTDKVAIHGALERGGPLVATVLDTVSAKEIQSSNLVMGLSLARLSNRPSPDVCRPWHGLQPPLRQPRYG